MSGGMTRSEVVVGGAAAAVGFGAGAVGVAAVVAALKPEQGAVLSQEIVAHYTSDELPIGDPSARAWRDAQRVIVPLAPQQVAPPVLEEPSVSEIVVTALVNDTEVGVRIEWPDAEVDDLDGVHRYHDAVAVQLPAQAGATPPPITMGGPGAPVHILQWRATWQRDLEGKTGVDQIYPRVVHDLMPDDIIPGTDPPRRFLPKEVADYYWVGRKVGNPLSQFERTTPIEQIVAEGFGTTTHLPDTSARGLGVHEDERWTVTIGVPSARSGVGAPLKPGSAWPIAFALWMGSAQNRGSRKHYAGWLTLTLEGP